MKMTIGPNDKQSMINFLKEMIAHRNLLIQFSMRQISIRYKQAVMGIFWVVVQPIVTTIIFTFIFGFIAKVPSDGVPYPVFVFAGLSMWQYFSRVVGEASGSFVSNAGIITKIYFPRAILPLSTCISAGVDYLISIGVLLVLMLIYGIIPGWQIVFLPVFFGLSALLAFSISLWFAPINALYRDVSFVLPFFIQVWMYLTPVIYPVSFIPEQYRWLMLLNPLTPLVEGVRWSILGTTPPPNSIDLSISIAIIIVTMFFGRRVFGRLETVMVDRV